MSVDFGQIKTAGKTFKFLIVHLFFYSICKFRSKPIIMHTGIDLEVSTGSIQW